MTKPNPDLSYEIYFASTVLGVSNVDIAKMLGVSQSVVATRKYRLVHPQRALESNRKNDLKRYAKRRTNPGDIAWRKAYYAKHYQENKDKYKASSANFRASNRDSLNEKKRGRRAIEATYNYWLDDIAVFYKTAHLLTEVTGIKYHVDHIRPIAAGGDHAPWNLQLLSEFDNCSKGASWDTPEIEYYMRTIFND